MNNNRDFSPDSVKPFFEQTGVETYTLAFGPGVPVGMERVFHPELGIGGVYGAWGQGYDNDGLFHFLESNFGSLLAEKDRMRLDTLGFVHRHHTPVLSDELHLALEVEVGARFLKEGAKANGWEPQEVDAVVLGMTGPITGDYTERITEKAGIPDSALKISVHKACDSSIGALHLVLNPELAAQHRLERNIARELHGKKVLVGGIEGLSRFVMKSRDVRALQLFGNGAGIIGVVPGETMSYLVGKEWEVYDEKGVLALAMLYPHTRRRHGNQSMIEVSQTGRNHLRFAGLMHEPENRTHIVMAGPMGMVKLFVRSGVQVVCDVFNRYQALMREWGMAKEIKVAIVHHANLKINQLKAKRLREKGVNLSMPWLLSEFGNVSAASNMIAFLRQLPSLQPGDHVLFDGFGAGTYYDTLAVAF